MEAQKIKALAKVNGVALMLIENADKLVPIRPICQALGIDEDTQKRKIESDEDFNSVATLSVATGADGKEYKMFCLPLEFVFGWLFTINPKNVKEEAREGVRKYRMECHKVLFKHFTKYQKFVIDRGDKITLQLDNYRQAQEDFKNAKQKMDKSRQELDQIRKQTFDDYEANGDQFSLFPEM